MKNKAINSQTSQSIEAENEFLQLKLMAELGAHTYVPENIPPWVENIFLRNVMAIEKGLLDAKRVKIIEMLGNPVFRYSGELNDSEVDEALTVLDRMMNEHHIALYFSGEYGSRLKYDFIINELFQEEISTACFPGMFLCFNYEEFYPNHKLDIETRTRKFITSWFERNTAGLIWELDDEIILPDSSVLPKNHIAKMLQRMFGRYKDFIEYSFTLDEVRFEIREDTGMGYSEGTVRYTAVNKQNEESIFAGSFKLFFSMDYHWWNIYYFAFPGFEFQNID